MFNKIRRIKKLSRRLEKFEPYEIDEEGNRLIRLHVHDDDYFLSPMSVEGVPCINDETAYLLNFYLKNMSVDSDEKLHFLIKGHHLTEDDKALYKKAIKNYYKEEFIDVQDQLKRNSINTISMLAIGIGVLLVKFLIGQRIIAEAIDICAWVFMWEAVDQFFLRRPELRIKQIQNLKVLEAKIDFEG